VDRAGLRQATESLRARLYRTGEPAVRDRVLERLSQRFAKWREVQTWTRRYGSLKSNTTRES